MLKNKPSVTFSESTVSFATKGAELSDNDGIEMQEKGAAGKKPAGATKEKRKIWLWIGAAAAIAILGGTVIGVLLAKNMIGTSSSTPSVGADSQADNSSSSSSSFSSSTDASAPATSAGTVVSTSGDGSQVAQQCTDAKDIPKEFQGTSLDQSTWLTMDGFNCTFTSEKVGGLPLIGLNSTWSDESRANQNVPALNKPWGAHGPSNPVRGVNIGGWLSLEPFITPSLFDYPKNLKIIDEWSLTKHLGPAEAAKVLEKHYATFITEDDFKNIAAAGLDHVRIPFSYWAVQTYDDDPYVPQISWRYLLRALEWCRKYGLRVNLDLHALPGSQNGWNHSGHSENVFNWIMGSDAQPGAQHNVNRQRSLDIHNQLSQFFAQPRYQNLIAFYGLANEPALKVPTAALVSWTTEAFDLVVKNGISSASVVFSESMKGLPAWGGQLQGHGDKLVLDVHEYLIFDEYLIGLTHKGKIDYACGLLADDVAGSAFGPTMVGEWSQADTDCTLHLNGVFNGARWNGTFFGDSPACPAKDDRCDCSSDMADPATYSDEYKLFLQTWAEAQMSAFERSWGYFYWTWRTESAPLWSYYAAWTGGFMPKLAYEKSWKCGDAVPDFGSLTEFI